MKRHFLTIAVTLAAILSPHLARCDTAVAAWARRYSNVTESTDQAYKVATDNAGNVIVAGETDAGETGRDLLVIKYSSAGVALWTNRYNGPANGSDSATAIAVDGNSDIVVAGNSAGNGSGSDYVTIKYSSSGAALWTNRYNGPANGDDYAWAMALDWSGKVFVTGTSYGLGTGDDILTIAYSSTGAALWTNRYNGPGNGDDAGFAIAVDAGGNVAVAGDSDGSVGNNDYATIRYSSSGATLWVNRYDGPANGYESVLALAVGSNGNAYVTGSSEGFGFNDDYATIAYSSAGAALWTNRYNGPGNGYDAAYALAVDGSNNVYVTGGSDSAGNNQDFATIKYSSTGAAMWTNRYNGPGNNSDAAYAIAVDGSGNVFVTGPSSSGTSDDFATVALSSAGTVAWIARYHGPGNISDEAYAVAVDGSGNVLVAGSSGSSNGGYDWATLKYSSVGVALWTNRYNGPGNSQDHANAVAVDGNGRIYVTGSSQGNGTGDDWATVAYSSTGVGLWTNRYHGAGSQADEAQAVAVGPGGNVFVTGYSFTGFSFDYATIAYTSAGVGLWTNFYDAPGDWGDYAQAVAVAGNGNVYVTGASSDGLKDDYATLAYSSGGAALWTNRYDGPGNDEDGSQALAVDAGGDVYVTGYSRGIDTENDYATIKYSSAGVGLWTNRYDGPGNGNDGSQAVAVDASGDVYVTGYSYGNDTDYDYVTIKYSGMGVALWTNRYNGPGNGDDQAQAVAVDGNGNVYVTGASRGNGTYYDYATIKYSSAGAALWTNRYDGSVNGEDRAQAVVVDGGGTIYVTGYSRGSAGDYDFATIAYSSAGAALWTNRYGPSFNGDDQPLTSRSMAVAGTGSVVVAGQAAGTINGSVLDYATVKYVTVPQLTITRPGPTTAKISWPFPSTDFRLQQNTNLNTANWTSPLETVGDDGTNKFISVSPPAGNRFYRLIYP